jgi:hypothetical protein
MSVIQVYIKLPKICKLNVIGRSAPKTWSEKSHKPLVFFTSMIEVNAVVWKVKT